MFDKYKEGRIDMHYSHRSKNIQQGYDHVEKRNYGKFTFPVELDDEDV